TWPGARTLAFGADRDRRLAGHRPTRSRRGGARSDDELSRIRGPRPDGLRRAGDTRRRSPGWTRPTPRCCAAPAPWPYQLFPLPLSLAGPRPRIRRSRRAVAGAAVVIGGSLRRRRSGELEARRRAVPPGSPAAPTTLVRVRIERDLRRARRGTAHGRAWSVIGRGEQCRPRRCRRESGARRPHRVAGHVGLEPDHRSTGDRHGYVIADTSAERRTGAARAASTPHRRTPRCRRSERTRLRPLTRRHPATALRAWRPARRDHRRARRRLACGTVVPGAGHHRTAARLEDPAVHEGLMHLPRHAHRLAPSRARVHRVRALAR